MADIEKVINGLECRAYDNDFPCSLCAYYKKDDEHAIPYCDYRGLFDDAIDLLKEQETTNICHKRNARIFSCEKCGYGLDDIYLTNERDYPIEPAYCPNCGRKVVDDA